METIINYLLEILFFIGLLIFIIKKSVNKKSMFNQILKRKERGVKMSEIAKNFIGKVCVICTINETITAVIKEVVDNGALIERDGNTEAINLEFVVRIIEYNPNKSNKKTVK